MYNWLILEGRGVFHHPSQASIKNACASQCATAEYLVANQKKKILYDWFDGLVCVWV